MKTSMLAAIAFLAFASPSLAGELQFPSDDPVATITFPDDWTAKETETGIDAISPDESIYFALDVAEAKDTNAVVEEAVKYLASQGVTVDTATAKESRGTLNGMEVVNVNWSGTDKDGPVTIGLAALAANAEKVLVATYWGTQGEQDKNSAAMDAIINSLKPVQ